MSIYQEVEKDKYKCQSKSSLNI